MITVSKAALGRAGRVSKLLGFGIIALTAASFMIACGDSNDETTPTPAGSGSASASPTSDPKVVAGYNACPPSGSTLDLTGAGATFPFPLYSKMIDEYQKLCNVKI